MTNEEIVVEIRNGCYYLQSNFFVIQINRYFAGHLF